MRSAGSGSQRPDGRWQVSVTLTAPDGTKRKQYVYGATQREAQAEARKLVAETKRVHIVGRNLNALWERWKAERWPEFADNTKTYYTWTGTRILAKLGTKDVHTLKPSDVAVFLRAVHLEGLSGRTVQMHRNTLGVLMAFGVSIGWRDDNPVREIRTPTDAKPKKRPTLTPAMARLIRIREKRAVWRDLWWCLMECGLRPAEALKLQREHLVRERSIWWLEVKGTKTEAAERRVPVPQALAIRLAEREGYLFAASTGNPLQFRNVTREWTKAVKEAGLPACNLYQLRKIAISRWVAIGLPDEVVKTLAGHTDIRLTKNVYNRVSIGRLASAMRAVGMSTRYADPLGMVVAGAPNDRP